MSLDGFIAGPGDSMDWGPKPSCRRAMSQRLRRKPEPCSWVAGPGTSAPRWKRRSGSTDYPFSGAMFLLSHRPLDPPDPGVSVLSGDIGDAVATALDAAGGKNLEILGADVAAQCFQRGLVDRGPGLCTAGAARRRRSLLCSGHDKNRAGTAQQQSVRRHDHPPVPRPQVVICPPRKVRVGHYRLRERAGMTPDYLPLRALMIVASGVGARGNVRERWSC